MASGASHYPERPSLNMQDYDNDRLSGSHQTNKRKGGPQHKSGIFTPLVLLGKSVLGEERLNKVRANAISMHSEVIGTFVDTAKSEWGSKIMEKLFETFDKNCDGKIQKEELKLALNKLGFEWLQEKQIDGILSRVDVDGKGYLTMPEFMTVFPKTLRTNLIKLAKKNGGELGFLS